MKNDSEKLKSLSFLPTWNFDDTLWLMVGQSGLKKIRTLSREDSIPDFEFIRTSNCGTSIFRSGLKRMYEEYDTNNKASMERAHNNFEALKDFLNFFFGYCDTGDIKIIKRDVEILLDGTLEKESFLKWYHKYKKDIKNILSLAECSIAHEYELDQMACNLANISVGGSVEKIQQVENKLAERKSDKGGRPGVDPTGEIASKIQDLKMEGVKDKDIPWNLRFTKFVQKMKSGKINNDYRNQKIPPRVKGPKYTKSVGISLDTAKKLIQNTPK